MWKRSLLRQALSVVSALMLVLAVQASAGRAAPGSGPPPPGANGWLADRPQYVVVLVLDGGLPAYFHLGDFPHLGGLARNGVTYSRAWDGMLESETPTGHASLGTGTLPRRHGVISFAWVNDSGNVFHPTDPGPIQQGELEHMLRQSGVPSIASALKQHDPNARVVVTSGHKDYAVDSVGGWAADYLMFYSLQGQNWVPQAIPRHVPPQPVMTAPGLTAFAPHLGVGDQDSLAVQLALSAFRTVHQRATIVNLPEFDWPLGHLQGGIAARDSAWQLMSHLDSDLARIEWEFWKAHVLDKTLFVVTADHGMETLNHTVSHNSIEHAVSAAGTSLIRYEFHTGGYLWLRDRSKAAQVATKIVNLQNPYIRAVYFRRRDGYGYTRAAGGQALAAGADASNMYLLSTLGGPTAPQVAIFLAENTSILGRYQTSWRGDHGGASWNAQHIPLILSGPGVRRGMRSSYPAPVVDIAPTILSLMGASPKGMDGAVLADALLQPSEAALRAQSERGTQLQPIVQSLIDQSKRDGP